MTVRVWRDRLDCARHRLRLFTPACALSACRRCTGWARSSPWSEPFPCQCGHHREIGRPDDVTVDESALANSIASAIIASRPDEPVLFSTRYRAAYAAIAVLRERDQWAAWSRRARGEEAQ